MSMIGRLRILSKEDKVKADSDPSLYKQMIYDESSVETDNWWDQLWFIYYIWVKKNKITDTPNPSIQKGQEQEYGVGEDMGYGQPHYLTPEQVVKVRNFLESTDSEQLVKYALTQEYDQMLYPHDWPEDLQGEHDWIFSYMDALKEYYKKAAEAGAGMLQAIV